MTLRSKTMYTKKAKKGNRENDQILIRDKKEKKFSLGKGHGLLELGNGQSRIEALGTCPRAVENGVAAVQRHGVVESVLASGGSLVTRIGNPAVGLEEDGGSEIFLRVPPVRRAGGAAAGAENALVQAVELAAVGWGLAVLTALMIVLVWIGRGSGRCEKVKLTSAGAVSRCRKGLMDLYCL
jgi:hypothetical protein